MADGVDNRPLILYYVVNKFHLAHYNAHYSGT